MTLSRGAPNWMEDAFGRFVSDGVRAPAGVGGQNVFTVFSGFSSVSSIGVGLALMRLECTRTVLGRSLSCVFFMGL